MASPHRSHCANSLPEGPCSRGTFRPATTSRSERSHLPPAAATSFLKAAARHSHAPALHPESTRPRRLLPKGEVPGGRWNFIKAPGCASQLWRTEPLRKVKAQGQRTVGQRTEGREGHPAANSADCAVLPEEASTEGNPWGRQGQGCTHRRRTHRPKLGPTGRRRWRAPDTNA